MTTNLDVNNPSDLLALTAYTLGYTPSDSLVIIGLQNGHTGLHLRVDLAGAMHSAHKVAAEYVPIFAQEHEACMILMFTSEEPRAEDDTRPLPEAALAHLLTVAMEHCGIDVAGTWQFNGGYAHPFPCESADSFPYPGIPLVDPSEAAEQLAPTTETTPSDLVADFNRGEVDPLFAAEIAEADHSAEEGLQVWDAVMADDLSTDKLTTAGMSAMLAVLTEAGSRGLIAAAAADLAIGYNEMTTTAEGIPHAADTTGPAPDWKRVDRLADALAVVTPYADPTYAANAYAVMGWVYYAKGQSSASDLFLDQAERAHKSNELTPAVRAAKETPSRWVQKRETAYRHKAQ